MLVKFLGHRQSGTLRWRAARTAHPHSGTVRGEGRPPQARLGAQVRRRDRSLAAAAIGAEHNCRHGHGRRYRRHGLPQRAPPPYQVGPADANVEQQETGPKRRRKRGLGGRSLSVLPRHPHRQLTWPRRAWRRGRAGRGGAHQAPKVEEGKGPCCEETRSLGVYV
jgi:hypothetical protein